MKKALLLAAVLAAMSFGTADASQFEMTGEVNIPGAYKGSYYATFKEGKKTVRFASVSRGANDYTLEATSKLDWLDNYDVYWEYSVKSSTVKGAPDYNVRQFRDVDTGRYYYAVDDIRYHEEPRRAFLIGFPEKKDKKDKQKSMVTYIDSNKVDKPEVCFPAIAVRKGNLILYVNDFNNPFVHPAYKLDWSPEAKWFGYEYFDDLKNSQYW